jgi:hypothetical protein
MTLTPTAARSWSFLVSLIPELYGRRGTVANLSEESAEGAGLGANGV